LYETLLTREEMAKAEDCGDYYRIKADNRDLNYNVFFTEGETNVSKQEDYHSHNTRQLTVKELETLLLRLPYVRKELEEFMPAKQDGPRP
jgi:UDP-glucose 4-epimerase